MYTVNLVPVNMHMIQNTKYTVSLDDIAGVMGDVYDIGKFDISEQTGSFFYDPWQLKPEFLGTAWETIWNSLPDPKGQGRIIILESPSCYTSHADIDNRWHLNLCGDEAYLIDLEKEEMFKTVLDGKWYDMDAGVPHTAMNIGAEIRAQLVVRKLLPKNIINDPQHVRIAGVKGNIRYEFDKHLSPWLNRAANNTKIISNVKVVKQGIEFDIEKGLVPIIPVPQQMELVIL
jgi:hypothetical protein|tara:strand:- start:16866 stop:17558 length:693 start_codon:yes stop_codon:yes gene_type:complete